MDPLNRAPWSLARTKERRTHYAYPHEVVVDGTISPESIKLQYCGPRFAPLPPHTPSLPDWNLTPCLVDDANQAHQDGYKHVVIYVPGFFCAVAVAGWKEGLAVACFLYALLYWILCYDRLTHESSVLLTSNQYLCSKDPCYFLCNELRRKSILGPKNTLYFINNDCLFEPAPLYILNRINALSMDFCLRPLP